MGSNPARSATKYGPDDELVVLLSTVELRSERRLRPSSRVETASRVSSESVAGHDSSVDLSTVPELPFLSLEVY